MSDHVKGTGDDFFLIGHKQAWRHAFDLPFGGWTGSGDTMV
jgi:hypothetical protein